MRFERPKKGAAKKWIEKNLSICPFCGLSSGWEIARDSRWKLTALPRHYFRCTNPDCMAMLSIQNASMIGDGRAFLFGGITGLAIKKAADKITGKKLKIESCGNNNKASSHEGREYSVETLRSFAMTP